MSKSASKKYEKSTKEQRQEKPAGVLLAETSSLFRIAARMEQLEQKEAETEQLADFQTGRQVGGDREMEYGMEREI